MISMITTKFIETVHAYFDELNYRVEDKPELEEFEKCAETTISRCKDLEDAIAAIQMYQYCLNKWKKIEKLFNKKVERFKAYEYEGNAILSLLSAEESAGTYYLTNAINGAVKDIFVISESLDERSFAFGVYKHGFTVFDDGEYYLKYAKMSSEKMKIFSKNGELQCNIVLSRGAEIFLENNITPYDLVIYEGVIGVYERAYIESLSDDEYIDSDYMIADIEWDLLKKRSKFGVTKVNIYGKAEEGTAKQTTEEVDIDLELILLFAASTFLVYQKHMQAQQAAFILINS